MKKFFLSKLFVLGLDDAAFAAVLSSAISAASAGGTAVAQGKLNKKNRKWQEKMYAIQKADALENWRRQNEYNSPAKQMQRFKEAGLNPNLIYGQGSAGNASNIDLGKPGNPDTSVTDFTPIGQAISNGFIKYYDIRQANANITNTERQNEILALKKEYQEAENQGILIDNMLKDIKLSGDKIALKFKEPLLYYSLEMNAQRLAEMRQNMQLNLNKDEREAVRLASDLRTAVINVAYIRAQTATTEAQRQMILKQIDNIKADTALKEQSYRFQKDGIPPNDGSVGAFLMRLIPPELMTDIQGGFREFYKENRKTIKGKAKKFLESSEEKTPYWKIPFTPFWKWRF